jgi:hypothetical protein
VSLLPSRPTLRASDRIPSMLDGESDLNVATLLRAGGERRG